MMSGWSYVLLITLKVLVLVQIRWSEQIENAAAFNSWQTSAFLGIISFTNKVTDKKYSNK